MTKAFDVMVSSARHAILHCLEDRKHSGKELETSVLWKMSLTSGRDGKVKQRRKPIHTLAFILAYKALETEGRIRVDRPFGVPFPLTDFQTTFTLKEA